MLRLPTSPAFLPHLPFRPLSRLLPHPHHRRTTTSSANSSPPMSLPPHADAILQKASRKAVAIALNYHDHALEMRSTLSQPRKSPYWFFKPSTTYLPPSAGPALLPQGALVHHEVELAVVIGTPARSVRKEHAHNHIRGFLCAVDLTARNWQKDAKDTGRPWSLAKGCDTFLPFSRILPKEAVPIDPQTGRTDVNLFLDVNGVRKQYGSTKDMIWTVPELIEHVSKYVTLEEWDLLLTGTPAGVGEVKHGDTVTAGIEGVVEMQFDAVLREAHDPQIKPQSDLQHAS